MGHSRVIVIGAGVGGLTAAALLATRGLDVTVIERAGRVGGKIRDVEIAGRRIDTGPTVLTMRGVLDEIFADCGSSLDQHLSLRPLDVLARHVWTSGARLDLFADPARSVDAIGVFAGADAARGYLALCADVRRTFETLDAPFIRASRPNLPQMLGRIARRGRGGVADIWHLQPYASMWNELGRFFVDQRLRQLFARYATYCGASPFAAPATLMLVAHVEQQGVWTVDGGMSRIADALSELAVTAGARVMTGRHVAEIGDAGGRVVSVRLDTGEIMLADAVVFNGDVAALASGHLGAAAGRGFASQSKAPRSLSAVTFSMTARCRGLPLTRHNVFFSDDYRAEFDVLDAGQRLPAAPTVYVCAQDRTEPDAAVETSPQRLLLLVNAPANGDDHRLSRQEIDACRHRIFAHLWRCGLEVEQGETAEMDVSTPSDFHHRFPATGGALYGPAPHGWMASFRRSGSRTKLPGLYLAGGSIHPGPGVPMAMLSGRQAAHCLIADLASSRTFPRAAMPGGMSTASATTARTP